MKELIALVLVFLLLCFYTWYETEHKGYTQTVYQFSEPKGRDCIRVKTSMWACRPIQNDDTTFGR